MPLIVITGFPCSGKSSRARQLAENFSTRIRSDTTTAGGRQRTVVCIPSQHSLSDSKEYPRSNLRDQIYNSAAAEKNARAGEFSAIKRALTKDAVVVADCLNYIKGYRYQLWCEAKAVGTRCCVVHVAAREDECQIWNDLRIENNELHDGNTFGTVTEGNKENAKNGAKPVAFGELTPESHTAIYGDRIVHDAGPDSFTLDVKLKADQAAESLKTLSLQDGRDSDPPSLAPASIGDTSTEDKPEELPQPPSNIPHLSPPSPISFTTYSPSTLHSLIMRYEPPSPFTRWDTPLFTIPSSDPDPPYDLIWAALFPPTAGTNPARRKGGGVAESSRATANDNENEPTAVKPHAATVLPAANPAEALQMLERTTQDICSRLYAQYQALGRGDEGGEISIPFPPPPPPPPPPITDANNEDDETNDRLIVDLPPGILLTQPMLQRLRRKFTQVQRGGLAHGRASVAATAAGPGAAGGSQAVAEAFVRFLDGEFGA